jgi:hypothetical protein
VTAMVDETRPAWWERFWSKVDKTGSGCWLWMASLGPSGRGQFLLNGMPRPAQRVSYELLVGPVPNKYRLDHTCGNKRCVNPAHLFIKDRLKEKNCQQCDKAFYPNLASVRNGRGRFCSQECARRFRTGEDGTCFRAVALPMFDGNKQPQWAIRFWAKVQEDESGCWLWQASVGSHGYGQFNCRGRGFQQRLAHRLAYELLVGLILEGLTLDHLCRVRRCINPDHLEPVTLAENKRRGMSPSAVNARKTHCKRGHALTSDNLVLRSRPGRECLICARNRHRTRESQLG